MNFTPNCKNKIKKYLITKMQGRVMKVKFLTKKMNFTPNCKKKIKKISNYKNISKLADVN